MDRRGFLRSASLLIAGAAIDPELLVWTPKAMITVPGMPSRFVVLEDSERIMSLTGRRFGVWISPIQTTFPNLGELPAPEWTQLSDNVLSLTGYRCP